MELLFVFGFCAGFIIAAAIWAPSDLEPYGKAQQRIQREKMDEWRKNLSMPPPKSSSRD